MGRLCRLKNEAEQVQELESEAVVRWGCSTFIFERRRNPLESQQFFGAEGGEKEKKERT
jgi:hypothetical protein